MFISVEERLSNGKMGQNKHNYKIYQSPSVEIAGLNKSPGKILRSVNRKHAFMAMDQEEKQKLSVNLRNQVALSIK